METVLRHRPPDQSNKEDPWWRIAKKPTQERFNAETIEIVRRQFGERLEEWATDPHLDKDGTERLATLVNTLYSGQTIPLLRD